MKHKIHKLFGLMIVIFIISFIFPFSVSAAPLYDGRTVIGESYTLESGRILDGDLTVIGGVVEIKEDATINGNVFILGGLITIDGTIKGDLTAIGGKVNLEANAVIEGDFIYPATHTQQETGAVIEGEQTEGWNIPSSNINLPVTTRRGFRFIPIFRTIGRITATALVLVALGALLLLIMPNSTETMNRALIAEPWHVLGYGALTTLVMLFGGIILTITICFIPVVVIVGLAFGLAVLVGWLSLGYMLGQRIATVIFKTSWHPVLASALGNLVLYLIAKSVGLIPCLGGFLVFVAMIFGLGMTVVTLFGTHPYPRQDDKPDNGQILLFNDEMSNEEDAHVVVKPVDEEPSQEMLLVGLGLDSRVNTILIGAGLTTVDSVLEKFKDGEQSFLKITGFGRKSLADLKTALGQKGYQIPDPTD